MSASFSIKIDGLGHSFSDGEALFRSLSISLEPGRSYAITGPSGSGKSTLLSILAGWLAPSEGSVSAPREYRTTWVFQNPVGVAHRTAIDHVVLPLLARGVPRKLANQRARELLTQFGLADVQSREFASLSGGEAQRLMLARGLACEADLLLVDEPTAQLDLHTAATVNQSLAALHAKGTITVIATHDETTREFCTDVIDLRDFQ